MRGSLTSIMAISGGGAPWGSLERDDVSRSGDPIRSPLAIRESLAALGSPDQHVPGRICWYSAFSLSGVKSFAWQREMIFLSSASTLAMASGIWVAISWGMVTTPCWSAWTRSPGLIQTPPT
jgi:hypothetical protein